MQGSEIEEARRKAGEYFGNGFHCAEAVAAAVLESRGEDSRGAAAHATAFGGGIGKSFTEICGALCGGLIVIGHFHGRERPGEDWDLPAGLGDRLLNRFQQRYHTTNCGSLCRRFGETAQMDECRKIVEEVTGDLIELLDSTPAGKAG